MESYSRALVSMVGAHSNLALIAFAAKARQRTCLNLLKKNFYFRLLFVLISTLLICFVKFVRNIFGKVTNYNTVVLDNLTNTLTLTQMFYFVCCWTLLSYVVLMYAPYHVYLTIRSIYLTIVQLYPYFVNPILRQIVSLR